MKDQLSIAMQNKAISITEFRLGRSIAEELKAKIRSGTWGYKGLEEIIDTVRTINLDEIEQYLDRLCSND